jgi:hypothetical protein
MKLGGEGRGMRTVFFPSEIKVSRSYCSFIQTTLCPPRLDSIATKMLTTHVSSFLFSILGILMCIMFTCTVMK